MEKNIEHKVQPLTKRNRDLYREDMPPPILQLSPLMTTMVCPILKYRAKKISNSINRNRNVLLTLLLIIKTF